MFLSPSVTDSKQIAALEKELAEMCAKNKVLAIRCTRLEGKEEVHCELIAQKDVHIAFMEKNWPGQKNI